MPKLEMKINQLITNQTIVIGGADFTVTGTLDKENEERVLYLYPPSVLIKNGNHKVQVK